MAPDWWDTQDWTAEDAGKSLETVPSAHLHVCDVCGLCAGLQRISPGTDNIFRCAMASVTAMASSTTLLGARSIFRLVAECIMEM